MFIPGKQINLSELVASYVTLLPEFERAVTGINLDSQKVKAGDLFFAYPGDLVDGRDYISDAIKRGAIAIISEGEESRLTIIDNNIPLLTLPQLREKVGDFAAKFYGNPSHQLTVIGITGTSGKTSCAYFIAAALSSLDYPCGFIGTVGAGFIGNLSKVINTTPDAITLQSALFSLLTQGAKAVTIEVSSHSLVQKRVQGIEFEIAVFTNLSRDHLDYHQNMQAYASAKKLLFMLPKLKYAVINGDDDFGATLLPEISKIVTTYSYGINNQAAVSASDIKLSINGIKAQINTPWGSGTLTSKLLGRINVSNLLAVLAVLGILKIKLTNALHALSQLTTVPGRLQALGGGNKPLVVIDYAHKPDALEKVLECLREHTAGVIWCVFGCGGDRDRGKRPMMGRIAERLSDHIIITNDNPRTENPQQIVQDVLQGLLCPWAAEVEYDRRVAIAHAIDCAGPGDVVLIAGKGHEDYQVIGKEKIHFSDYEETEKQLKIKN